MLGRQRQIRSQVQSLLDLSIFAASFWVAYNLRAYGEGLGPLMDLFQWFGGTPEIDSFASYFPIFVLSLPVAFMMLLAHGLYNRPWHPSRKFVAWQFFKVCTWVTIVVVLLIFFLKVELARGVIIIYGVLSFVLLMLKEEFYRYWLRRRVHLGDLKKRLILVGTSEDTSRLRGELEEKSSHDIQILDELNVNETSVDHLVDLLHEHSANGVILSTTHTYFGQVEKVIQACELEGVEVWLLADFFKTQISQTVLDDFYGRPMLVFRSTPLESWQGLLKQALDYMGALVLVLFLSVTVLIPVAIAIRMTSKGPILFRQKRCGLNGRPFTMLKFRSMVTDAEQRKHELEQLNEMSGPVFKLNNDPRVTSVGRILRRYSLDELPQLFNVLQGDMSLVGPRPLPVDEVKRFDDLAHRRRLSVKPGLTCLWQISGRNNVTDFKDWVRLDLEYIDNWSLWLDVKILLRTVPVVFQGTGAR